MNREREVLVIHGADGALENGLPVDALAVKSVAAAVEGIVGALRDRGWRARAVQAPAERQGVLGFVAGLEGAAVFNQVESLGGDARGESLFAAALELRGLPFTGSGPRALALCLEKPLARAVLAARGVPIARGALLSDARDPLPPLAYPVIVKPSREDASHGITLDSVVHGEAAARERARFVIDSYAQPALVEEYVAGREFNVALTESRDSAEPCVLSVSEIEFTNFPAGAPRIVTYGGKWIEGSPEWDGTRSVEAGSDPAAPRLEAAALAAWRALDLRGYARVDLRLEDAPPHRLAVIDVNPNPDLSPEAGLALSAVRRGTPYAQLIESILDFALRRELARARGA